MVVTAIAAILATRQFDNETPRLKGHNLKLMRAISEKDFASLRPYIRGSFRIQHIGNIYKDEDQVFAKRFSSAQLERNWHVAISSETVTKATSDERGHMLLSEFSKDIGDELVNPEVWYPQLFDDHGKQGICAKIASGAFYIFELSRTDGKKPHIVRLWDLDHAKDWEDVWFDRERSKD